MSFLPARLPIGLLIAVFTVWTPIDTVEGQILRRIREAAKEAAESEAVSQIDRRVRETVRCAFNDEQCIERARAGNQEVVLTDSDGTVLTNEAGETISDPSQGADLAAARMPAPGEGVWANYDFVPGDRILYYDDFSRDNVGDFPRRMTLLRGNWEVVEWQGRRLLRNLGPRHSAVTIPLPEELPERFTIETEAYFPHTNQIMLLATKPSTNNNQSGLQGNHFKIASGQGAGVEGQGNLVTATNRVEAVKEYLVPIRIMVDGSYAKMYVGERRVANVPNATIVRSDHMYLINTYFADEEHPMLLGPIRVAAGGADLYSVLDRDGRVATQGILFATGSARLRPESTPTLNEIGTMLRNHADLRISIEGHTDSVGDDEMNQSLSEERAAAVKTYLTESLGIDASRLESVGYGESRPAASNDSPEGREQNRRVELVRLGS